MHSLQPLRGVPEKPIDVFTVLRGCLQEQESPSQHTEGRLASVQPQESQDSSSSQ